MPDRNDNSKTTRHYQPDPSEYLSMDRLGLKVRFESQLGAGQLPDQIAELPLDVQRWILAYGREAWRDGFRDVVRVNGDDLAAARSGIIRR